MLLSRVIELLYLGYLGILSLLKCLLPTLNSVFSIHILLLVQVRDHLNNVNALGLRGLGEINSTDVVHSSNERS